MFNIADTAIPLVDLQESDIAAIATSSLGILSQAGSKCH